MTYRTDLITGLIRDVPDFPEPGVTFKDITPLLANANGYAAAISELVDTTPRGVDVVLGMEARGFMFAGPVALSLGAGFVPVRKPGKLPGDVYSQSFVLEYGSATLTVHQDAVQPGSKVLIVDDILATAGTVGATASLVEKLGGELVGVSVLMELSALGGREKLDRAGIGPVNAVITV
ncbi:adenine phosphoribosyltransferase [Cutibacterium avidum]|uniref:adenine phosphoribosyltransferase n=1 Tax=Cutibacterium avidum TaxID=33010 RepID=UPI001C3295A3|nr:adenine phosphoribosyltransferase [Cutibacterium avidum]BCQ02695.1 adenine phosphoribosyltransferase [Cutibacterium avidum]